MLGLGLKQKCSTFFAGNPDLSTGPCRILHLQIKPADIFHKTYLPQFLITLRQLSLHCNNSNTKKYCRSVYNTSSLSALQITVDPGLKNSNLCIPISSDSSSHCPPISVKVFLVSAGLQDLQFDSPLFLNNLLIYLL